MMAGACRRGDTGLHFLPIARVLLALCLLNPVMSALAQPSAQSSTPAGDDETYVAQPGDTMNAISGRFLHEGETPRVQRALQRHNKLSDPDLIHPGFVVRLPRAWLKSRPSALEVVAVQGEVRSKGQPLQLNAKLAAGDDVRTGANGYATLRLADGTTLTLLPSANAGVERAQAAPGGATDTQFRLDAGRVETAVPRPARGNTRFEVRTPMAIAAVRGTKFRVTSDVQKNAASSEVVEGEVQVADSGRLGSVDVRAGFGTRVNAGSAPLAPRALLPAPFLWTGVQLVERPQVEIPINPLRGAQAYRLFVATREDFSNVILEQVLRTPVIRLERLVDGDYFVRLRGIDDIELEGRDTTARMRVSIRPEPPRLNTPPHRSRTRDATLDFAWQSQPGVASYVLQVARDAAFRSGLREWADIREPRQVVTDVVPGTYFWRVAYVQQDGQRSMFSEVRSFELRAGPRPPNPPKVEDDVLALSWPSEPGQSFELQLAADPGFTRLVEQRRISEPHASLPRPAQGVYHLRIRATDADGTIGPFSAAVRVEVPKKPEKPACLVEGPGGVCAMYAPTPPVER